MQLYHHSLGALWSHNECPPVRGPFAVDEVYRQRVMIDVIHDGPCVPAEMLVDWEGRPIPEAAFLDRHLAERDWGAGMVAAELAAQLGLDAWYNVEIARVVMDFGRFPGSTPPNADHMQRFAINYPFSDLLGRSQKRTVLEDYYDGISHAMDQVVPGKLLKIAVHTYDRANPNGIVRPPVSLVTRSASIANTAEGPTGVFDALYPHILGEFTADRVLRNRLALTLEKAGLGVGTNYPYLLPEGSIEMRAQVWFFFDFLRRAFEAERPDTAADPAYVRVWAMLADTNLRDSESEQLRSYLHLYRRPPRGQERAFRDSQEAYEDIHRFVLRDDMAVVRAYRFHPDRPSTMGIEVRKDLLHEFDADGRPVAPKPEMAVEVARLLAEAVCIWLHEDLPERATRLVH